MSIDFTVIAEELEKQRDIQLDTEASYISAESHPEQWETLMEAWERALEIYGAIADIKNKAIGRKTPTEEDEELEAAYERGREMTNEEYEAWHRQVWGF